MRLIIGLVALLVMIASPRSADACSCTLPQPAISPADGSTGVPLNARILVSFDVDSVVVELRAVANQVVIPLTFDVHRRTRGYGSWQIADAVSLQANTQYELLFAPPYENGPRLRTTFTTGDSTDVTPSVFAGIDSISLETMTYPIVGEGGRACHSSCVETGGSGHISRLRLGHVDPPPDVALLVFELLRESDRAVIDQVPMYPRGYGDIRALGTETCERQAPVLDPGERYCGRLTAYDVAGNMSGQTAEVCSEAATCTPSASASANGCEPDPGCVPQAAPKESATGCATTSTPTSGMLVVLLFAATRRRQRR